MEDTQRLGILFVLAPVAVFASAIVLVRVAAAVRALVAPRRGSGEAPEAARRA